MPGREKALDVVVTAAYGVVGRFRERYDEGDVERAQALLRRVGLGAFADRRFGTLSEGERKRVLLARALMTDPELMLLDEPAAGLDLGAREALLRLLTRLAHDVTGPPSVLVTHHVEEVPIGTTHALLLARGRSMAAGPVREVLTGPLLTRAFGLPLEVEERGGRFAAAPPRPGRLRPAPPAARPHDVRAAQASGRRGRRRRCGGRCPAGPPRGRPGRRVAAGAVAHQHVVEVEHRQPRGERPRQPAAPLVVRVAQPGVEQRAERRVVAVGVEVAEHDRRQLHGPHLLSRGRRARAPQLLEHRQRRQRVLGEQADARPLDVDGRARQLAAADRTGRHVLERQPAEQADGLLAVPELGDDVRQVLEQARAAQPAQAAGVELGHDDDVGVQPAAGPGRPRRGRG